VLVEKNKDIMGKVKELYKADYPQEVFIRNILSEYVENFINAYIYPRLENKMRVLDVGCGKQPFRSIFEDLGLQYCGLDYKQNDSKTVDIVEPIDTEFIHKYAHMERFDFVICTEVLEHVADWDIAFKNISRLTKKDGFVLITCPHIYQLHEEPYDFWRPTPYSIKYFSKKYNFDVVEFTQAGSGWDVLGTILTNNSFYIKSNKLKDRIIFRLLRYGHQWLVKNLINNILQRKIGTHSSLYLSNIAVLKLK
jgi:SAM-dependent methyltransferase